LSNIEPVVIIGGFLSAPGDYNSWRTALAGPPYRRRSYVAEISRVEWSATRDQSFRPQLKALATAVARARRETGAEKVWLVCHSAGGRIARLWMGDQPYGDQRCGGHPYVRGVIFLGSPYTTAEPWARRSSAFANEHYPGAFYPDIKYVSVIGKAVLGRRNGSLAERLAYRAYSTLDPQHPDRWGDGVITMASAQVPGAENIVLNGIHHVGILGRPGYGAPSALKVWASSLATETVASA
jgi:pimeloyl-ACP methyl ester carboxylesterase